MSVPEAAAELSWGQVHAFRLARHHLDERARSKDLVAVAGAIGGAQAQLMSAAELQLGVRTGSSVREVRSALWERKTLVKTWLMRGTLHLIPSGDLPLYTAAMSGGWMRTRPAVLSYLGATEPELTALIDTIGGLLSAEPMTRQEIVAVAGKGQSERLREWLKSGWGGFLKPVARAGLLCFGPSRGQSVTFVQPQQWLGGWREVDPKGALIEVARRYLRAYGPATSQDFAHWWGRWAGVGAAAWAGLEKELVTVSVEGRRAQMLAADLRRLSTAAAGSVRLLPAFDPYLMGYASRSHLFAPVHRPKVSRTAGWISAVLLVNGRVEGTWTHSMSKGRLSIRLAPFGRLSAAVRSRASERGDEVAEMLGVAGAELKVV